MSITLVSPALLTACAETGMGFDAIHIQDTPKCQRIKMVWILDGSPFYLVCLLIQGLK